MANSGLITSLLVIFGVINILAVLFSSILGAPTIGDYVVYQMFSKEDFSSQSINDFDDSFQEGFDKTKTDESTVGGLFAIFDGLKKVFSFLITVLSLGFALFFQLQIMGAPFALSAIIGLPIAIAFYLGIVSAVRGFAV